MFNGTLERGTLLDCQSPRYSRQNRSVASYVGKDSR
jgi:hypothetical protein